VAELTKWQQTSSGANGENYSVSSKPQKSRQIAKALSGMSAGAKFGAVKKGQKSEDRSVDFEQFLGACFITDKTECKHIYTAYLKAEKEKEQSGTAARAASPSTADAKKEEYVSDGYEHINWKRTKLNMGVGGLVCAGIGAIVGYISAFERRRILDETGLISGGGGAGAGVGAGLVVGAASTNIALAHWYAFFTVNRGNLYAHLDQISHVRAQLHRLLTFELTSLNWVIYMQLWESLYNYLKLLKGPESKKEAGAASASNPRLSPKKRDEVPEAPYSGLDNATKAAADAIVGNKRLIWVLEQILEEGIQEEETDSGKNHWELDGHNWQGPRATIDAFDTIRMCFNTSAPPPGIIAALTDMTKGLQTAKFMELMRKLDREVRLIEQIQEMISSVKLLLSNAVLSGMIAAAGIAGDYIYNEYVEVQEVRNFNASDVNASEFSAALSEIFGASFDSFSD
jgi:hypothetical protein